MKFYKSFGVSLRRIIHIIFCVMMMGRDISIFISDLCKKMGCVLKLQDKEQAWCPCFKSSCKGSRVHFSSLMFLVILTGLNTCSWRVSFFCSTHVFLLNFATSALCICTIIQTFGMIMPHGMLKMALQTQLRWFSKGLSRLYQVIILSF